MRLLAALCVVVCSRYAYGDHGNNYVECQQLQLPFVQDPNMCINTTLIDCENVLVRVTLDFDNDDLADWDSNEFQVSEGVEVCYTIPVGDVATRCTVCAKFTDVDATGDGATFDPFLTFSGGPSNVCGLLGEVELNQVQVGSDCNDNLLKSSCFLNEHCGWCEATQRCESISSEDDETPHCADCPGGWEVAPFNNGGNQGSQNGGDDPSTTSTSNALAYGLGIGIPLILVLAGCGFFLYKRNKAIGTGGYDFERHSDENSRSQQHGTTILMGN